MLIWQYTDVKSGATWWKISIASSVLTTSDCEIKTRYSNNLYSMILHFCHPCSLFYIVRSSSLNLLLLSSS